MAALSENVGMGMMGTDVSFAQKAMQGDEKSKAALMMMLGGGLDSLANMMSGKSSEGVAPSQSFDPSKMASMQPVAPVDYSLNAGQNQAVAPPQDANQPQVAGAVMPIKQLNPTTTDQTQPTVGGYRKFLRFQDFGSTQQ